jgi:uncharacterized glyoxalase superfamily protein PhnB
MRTETFRFAYFTLEYETTISFYKDTMQFPIAGSWNRGENDRGTLFKAESGLIEILARPNGGDSDHFFDERPPQGAFMVVQVKDVQAAFSRAKLNGAPIKQPLIEQKWGHRSFCVVEPNGLVLYFYEDIARPASAGVTGALRVRLPLEPRHDLTPVEIDALEDRIYEHNRVATGRNDAAGIGFVIHDETGRTVGA